jgi:shikimate dehydrogenase
VRAIDGHTRVFALLGRPVAHSLSPAMHNHLFRAAGLNCIYVALEVRSDALDLAATLRGLGLSGVNLTVPFKSRVVEQLDAIDDVGRAVGAVNVVLCEGGRLLGSNSDAEGFCRSYEERFGAGLAGAKAVLLGAGGAARGVAAGLCVRGVREVAFLNRSVGRAEQAAARLGAAFPTVTMSAAPLVPEAFAVQSAGAGLVVNCTSGAGAPAVARLDASRMPEDAPWCDLNYWMADPPHLRQRRAAGLPVLDGLGMLVHQGAIAFETFTGQSADPVEVRRVLMAVLSSR